MDSLFAEWRQATTVQLKALQVGLLPKKLIVDTSEGLLQHYADKKLIDAYPVYQHLMDYWESVMQDDCYLIAADGWRAEPYRVTEKNNKGKEVDKGWTCDLVPKELVVRRFFLPEQQAIDELTAESEAVAGQISEMEEEHGGEEGYFAELDKVNKANVQARLKEVKNDKGAAEERQVLETYLALLVRQGESKRKIKEAETALDALALARYKTLTVDEIKTLVVDDKWMTTLEQAICGEVARVNQRLTLRIKELAERYESPLPELSAEVDELEQKVAAHLAKMGFTV